MFNRNQKGFGLLEVIIAVFIVAIGLVGILALANISLKGPSLSRDRLIASGLAQEGIEVIRDMRRANAGWSNWHAAVPDGDWRVQYDSVGLTIPYSGAYLKMNANGLYQYDSGTETLFKRKITLSKISADEVKIITEVNWQTKGQTYTLTAEDRLWNWK